MRRKIRFIGRTSLIIGMMLLIMGLVPNYSQETFAGQVKDSEDKSAQKTAWKPTGSLTFIVCTGAGNAYDFTARQIAQVLPDYLGKPVIVQNISGGAGGSGLDALHNARPDGRTFALFAMDGYISHTVVKRYKWDTKDFNIIALIDAPPWGVLANKRYSSYKDLLAAKKDIGFALSGQMLSVRPVLLELEKNGVKYKGARFKSSAEANLAVIAGDADICLIALTSIALDPIRAGDLRPLWVFADKRYPALPDLPTHIELGMPRQYSYYNLVRMIGTPPGVPDGILAGLKGAVIKALQDKRTLEWSKKADIPVNILEQEVFKERVNFITEHVKSNMELFKKYIM